MAFGKNSNTQAGEDSETVISEIQQGFIDVDDAVQQASATGASASQAEKLTPTKEKDATKPLLYEVTILGTRNSKNSGGSKQ